MRPDGEDRHTVPAVTERRPARKAGDKYRLAAEKLSRVGGSDTLGGRLARYYEGMAHRSLGIEAIRSGRFAAGERHLREALACMGRRADLTRYLCSLYVQTGRYERCADEMGKAASLCRNDPAGWRNAAQALWRAGKREEAFMTLTSALRKFANNAPLLMQLGLFHAGEGRYQEAGRHLARAAQADAANADAHRYLALSHAAEGQLEAAARSFQRAWELRPSDIMLSLQLAVTARAASENGRPMVIRLTDTTPAEASESHIRQMAAYIQQNPDFVDAFLALPASDVDEDLFSMLSNVLRTSLGEHPRYADMHLRFSRVLERLGRNAQAIVHARRAVEINGTYVQGLIQLARLCHADERAEAERHLKQAINCGADWPDVHCMAGELMRDSDRPEEARLHFRRALELKAGYPRAAEALASLAA
ncbi:MAG: hypothetical protein ABIH17_09730 [Pseudomonadota bacterium]